MVPIMPEVKLGRTHRKLILPGGCGDDMDQNFSAGFTAKSFLSNLSLLFETLEKLDEYVS